MSEPASQTDPGRGTRPAQTRADGSRPSGRPLRSQAVLRVLDAEQLTPHLVRVVAGGPGIADIRDNDSTDKYAKLYFADSALGLEPPYDLEALRERLPVEQLPSMRTYTLHHLDTERQRVSIDFVTHGDEGLAGPWAAAAQPGETLVLSGAGGGYRPDPDADAHLLIGDDSALPAITAALEAMPAEARGVALLETDRPEDVLDLAAPSGVRIEWLFRQGADPGSTTLLVDALRALPRGRGGVGDAGDVQVFAHGEREAMKALRSELMGERGVARARLSLSAYWARGRAEDRFQAEKREPIGQIFPE